MANVLVNEDSLTGIADAIRSKNGSTDTYKPSEMAAAISAISGGGGPSIPDSTFVISGNAPYWNYGGKWDTFIKAYKDRWSTSNLEKCNYMFDNCKLDDIPFNLNINSNFTCSSIFADAILKAIPSINGFADSVDCSSMFSYCINLKNIPDGYFNFVTGISDYGSFGSIFSNCNSLRNFPTSVNIIARLYSKRYSASLYYYMCNDCYVLDEITNLGVSTLSTWTSNAFQRSFANCNRLKKLTFESGKTANWKNQTIDLSMNVGYGLLANSATRYGIDVSKFVNNDSTYAALKDDADWFTSNVNYSRYNHDSAVETINSLPDTSTYLATAGGTNTIKFYDISGSATDGGAINTLTEEEIAVATAKGWTISLV